MSFRPGISFGIGEVTTTFAVNLDVLYRFPGSTSTTQWAPYVGIGPTFGTSHKSFEADIPVEEGSTTRNRFNFSDSDFVGGANFIAGVRARNGLFFEMNATTAGVSNVRLLAGYNF